MRKRRIPGRAGILVVGLSALAALLGWPRGAEARCCAQDADCPRGFLCTGGFCGNELADCHCDADCAPGLVCLARTKTVCPSYLDGGCYQAGSCVAPWQAPCAVDADCGDASFECVTLAGGTQDSMGFHKDQACELRSDACGDAAACPPETCTTDQDCPQGWTCWDDSAECFPPNPGGPAIINGQPPPSPPSSQKRCHQPYWELIGGIGGYVGYPVPRAACPSTDATPPTSADAAAAARGSGSACAIGGAETGAPASWMALLGLLAALTSRSQRCGARRRGGRRRGDGT
jgi:hypothetical protein